ncbi:PREDICTED: ELL-associated factor 2 [Tarenaya hassleriana]|uniref:ELL-associated factor 2 n=1 Tax=Tarenaya hassleriana TaxID=28532 RepID=UPI00053C8278|nr:PREDICTED: ELL-associated factor 2 [Tarenaya hassleriana]
MESGNVNGEPSTAPEPNRWYDIKLGPSFKDTHSYSPRFCTLRYEFKPASIDNTQPGSLHKSKENRVSVEFQNNQRGKPKVSFEGVSEDYKDKEKDAILFFDGETFRLERLNRAVKRLRYVRVPGESVPAPNPTTVFGLTEEPHPQSTSKLTMVDLPVTDTVQAVKVAEIDISNPVSFEHKNEDGPYSSGANPPVTAQDASAYESEEDVNIDDDEDNDDGQRTTEMETTPCKEFRKGGLDIDINLPHPAEMEDEEIIADVDINDDESYKGLNAAEALRAQLNAEAREERQSSSSSSEGKSESTESKSESSGCGSGSSSSESSSSNSSSSESSSPNETGSCASL